MVVGGALYAEVFPWVKSNVVGFADLGKETLVTATGLSPWWFMAVLVMLAAFGFAWLERGPRRRHAHT